MTYTEDSAEVTRTGEVLRNLLKALGANTEQINEIENAVDEYHWARERMTEWHRNG